jgi:predicted transcriptional regulator
VNIDPEYARLDPTLDEILLWQRDQIEQSLKQADAGILIPHSEVKKTVRSWKLTRPRATDTAP